MLSFAPAFVLALALVVQYHATTAQTCTFVLGFAALHDRIPDLVGICTRNVEYDAVTGDGVQTTSTGLLVWRKTDNLTAFTNGSETWLDGPLGVQMRLNSQRFSWEPNPDHLAVVPTPQAGDRCVTAGTTVTLIGTDSGAGNAYATFGLTNLLSVPCTFYGFVGAELRDANDYPLPTNVVRDSSAFPSQPGARLVTAAPSGLALFRMHWTQVPRGNELTCPASSSLGVTLPDQFIPLTVPITIRACNGGQLDVTAVEPAGSPSLPLIATRSVHDAFPPPDTRKAQRWQR
jgi:hypothetical protein